MVFSVLLVSTLVIVNYHDESESDPSNQSLSVEPRVKVGTVWTSTQGKPLGVKVETAQTSQGAHSAKSLPVN